MFALRPASDYTYTERTKGGVLMSAILQLVIGLIFIYSLMGILVTQINAVVASALNLRAKNLRESLENLVNDRKLQAEILSHPLIKLVKVDKEKLLSLQLDNKGMNEVLKADLTRVDYIAPATFVEALVGLLIVRAYSDIDKALKTIEPELLREQLDDEIRKFISLPSDEQLGALRQLIDNAETSGIDVKEVRKSYQQISLSFSEIRNRKGDLFPLLMGVGTIEIPVFREALKMVVFRANDANEAIKKLEAWFDDGMNRATTLFREKLQQLSIIAGVALVVILNIDTLAMTRAFWIDPTLRETVAAAAEEFVQTAPAANPDSSVTPADPATSEADPAQELEDNLNDARSTVNQLLSLSVPIGWSWIDADCTSDDPDQQRICESPNNLKNFFTFTNPNWFSLVVGKFIGLIASAIAAAQGAPFWFDMLRKLTARN